MQIIRKIMWIYKGIWIYTCVYIYLNTYTNHEFHSICTLFGLYWIYLGREQRPNMGGEGVNLGLQQGLQFYVLK